jgi:hypothetical protein
MKPAAKELPDLPQNAADRTDWYIYYRARTEYATDLQRRVESMQARLRKEFGIAGALKRRPLPQDGRHTWMEIYTAVPHNFEAILADAMTAAGLLDLTDGDRHVEFFVDPRFADINKCA